MLPLSHSSRPHIRLNHAGGQQRRNRVLGDSKVSSRVTIVPHHQTEGNHSGLGVPQPRCHSSPMLLATPSVANWDWEAWERGDGDRGIRIPALRHGRRPSPGVRSSLASCPGSVPRKLGSGCTTSQHLGTLRICSSAAFWGFSCPFHYTFSPPVSAGVTESRSAQQRWAQMPGFNESSQ